MDNQAYIMDRATKIKLISTIILIGFAIAVFYHYIMGAYLNQKLPVTTFLFLPQDRFNDFFNMVSFIKDLNPYNHPKIYVFGIYYPLGELFFFPFTFFSKKIISLSIYLFIFIVLWIAFTIKNFSQRDKIDNWRDLFTITFLTYPLIFTIDRANVELYIFLLLCGFVFFYRSLEKNQLIFSIVCLSLAIAMKPFPALFLVLLAKEKRWKHIFYVITIAVLISILSLLCFEGNIWDNLQGLRRNQALFVQDYVIGAGGWPHSISLFGLIKVVIAFVIKLLSNLGWITSPDLQSTFKNWVTFFLRPYSILSLAIVVLVIFNILKKENLSWKNMALIVFLMNIISPASADYRLLNLFIPLAFFVNEQKVSKYDRYYTVMFGVLMIPKSYYLVPFMTSVGISIGVIINPLLILLFGSLILLEKHQQTRDKM
jgi:hypothetical protein